jgi:predicted ABC-type ATPase
VRRRAGEGGHDVPPEKIKARWHRSLAQLPWFAAHASAFWVFDNSDENPVIAPLLAARGAESHVNFIAPAAPAWVRTALAPLFP